MKQLFSVPVWGLIFTVMACYMQDSKVQAQTLFAMPITER